MYFPYSFWANTNLRTGLLGFWTFNDSGNIGKDNFGSRDLTSNGILTSVSAKISNGVRKNNTTGFLDIVDTNKIFNINGNKTFCFWIKFDTLGDTTNIFGKLLTAPTLHYSVFKTAVDRIQFSLYDSGGSLAVSATTSSVLISGTWYFVTCMNNFSTKIISVQINNNSPVLSSSYIGIALSDPTENFRAMERDLASQDSTMDALGIWNRILSPTEISYLYNNGSGREYPF